MKYTDKNQNDIKINNTEDVNLVGLESCLKKRNICFINSVVKSELKFSILYGFSFLQWGLIGSCEGISPLHSHGTVLETLASHGSSCLITNVIIHYGCTNFQ